VAQGDAEVQKVSACLPGRHAVLRKANLTTRAAVVCVMGTAYAC
jgi:hypothetical protein